MTRALAAALALLLSPASAQQAATSDAASNSTSSSSAVTVTPKTYEVNPLTASRHCASGLSPWYICTQPSGWGGMLYCPVNSPYNETQLGQVEWGEMGVKTPLMPCFQCPTEEQGNCSTYGPKVMQEAGVGSEVNSTLGETNVWDDAEWYCSELCEKQKLGETCNQDNLCNNNGNLFCDYADDADLTQGTCVKCPDEYPEGCSADGFSASVQGQLNCRETCRLQCSGAGDSSLYVNGEYIPSQPIDTAIQEFAKMNATGELIDCSDEFVLSTTTLCPGAEGKICIVYFEEQFALHWQVSNQAEKSGCVGLIFYRPGFYDSPFSHADSLLLIPIVYVTYEEGTKIKNKLGNATIHTENFGSACYPPYPGDASNKCDAGWPCDDGQFCEFNSIPVETGSGIVFEYEAGYCRPCPKDEEGNPQPIACFFDFRRDGLSETTLTVSTKTPQKVEECAEKCGAVLTSEGCKFCTSEVTGFEFAQTDEEDRCIFCPEYDMIYPDRIVPLFGEGVKCWQMESFFQKLPVVQKSRNCGLAQAMNFICGCDGTGYAGANTKSKQATLAWLPRIAAILSMLGSLFIIIDTQRTALKRTKLINKILCTMSVFDFIGSFAMAFTTLPTPSTDYIYGGRGNEKTCTAQGFLIQMGTIACFLGVSLALYYNLTIKQGWSESKMKRRKAAWFLIVPPIVIGFLYAGIGIPYYDNVLVWCNNSARWWPEAPVILSILYTTVVMVDVSLNVYKKEKASSRYTGGSNKLSKMVFKQALWFVGAFYITWGPYLALQYLWSSGTGYNIYGLTLAAATMVPLQGFWNFWVYARPRYFGKGKGLSLFRSTLGSRLKSLRRSGRRTATARSGNAASTIGNKTNTTQAGSTTMASSVVKSSTVKSSVAFTSSVADPEVVPFGAPDPNDNVVPFGAPDPNDDDNVVAFGEPDFNDDNVVPFDPSALDAPEPPKKSKEDMRYEMMLAG